MNNYRIPVVRGTTLQGGIKTVIGAITVKVIIEKHDIPERHTLNNKGYQRAPSEQRINNLASSIMQKKVDLPTALLVSLRDVKAEDVLIEDEKGRLLLDLEDKPDSQSHKLYVVDGQHRIKALEKSFNEQPHEVQNLKVPFVCMIGANENEEMNQFYVVNSNAKSVSTDLALDLLRHRAETHSEIMDELIKKGARWKIEAQKIVEKLNERDSSVWKDRIRLPNTPKGVTALTSSAMVKSLQELLKHSPTFSAIKEEEQKIQIIDAYWKGIKSVFEGTKVFENTLNHSIQKGVGATTLNGILPIVIEVVRSKGKSIFDPNSYADVIKTPLEKLEGTNGEGVVVKGADFWRSGEIGATSIFSSRQGSVFLREKLKSSIEDIRVE